MAFELIEDLHPSLHRLMWLVGNWHGNGKIAYLGQTEVNFEQDVMFRHDGREFLHYVSQSWVTDAEGTRVSPGELETGFLFARTDDNIELLISTHDGYGHSLDGRVDGPRMQFNTKWQARPETNDEYTEQRMYGLVDGDLMYAVDRQTPNTPMQSYSWGQLKRV